MMDLPECLGLSTRQVSPSRRCARVVVAICVLALPLSAACESRSSRSGVDDRCYAVKPSEFVATAWSGGWRVAMASRPTVAFESVRKAQQFIDTYKTSEQLCSLTYTAPVTWERTSIYYSQRSRARNETGGRDGIYTACEDYDGNALTFLEHPTSVNIVDSPSKLILLSATTEQDALALREKLRRFESICRVGRRAEAVLFLVGPRP
jgi:hypothetical protein